jgi:hypothetical protein
MKVKLYIVTYNNDKVLNEWSLGTIFSSDYQKLGHDVQVFVINNHSNLNIKEEYKDRVTVLENYLRPDFSTGHLSRNWNQALINGFRNPDKPDCDIVVCSQNDIKFKKDWLENLLKAHEKYNFVQQGQGDGFHSYTINAVKNVGLWDERFCNICYQEHDYFLRQLIYNRDNCTINSKGSRQIHNKLDCVIIEDTPCGSKRGEKSHTASKKHSNVSKMIFQQKWGGTKPAQWKPGLTWVPTKSKISSFIYYPYFEKKLLKLKDKGYVL